jgi:hypothetical protein
VREERRDGGGGGARAGCVREALREREGGVRGVLRVSEEGSQAGGVAYAKGCGLGVRARARVCSLPSSVLTASAALQTEPDRQRRRHGARRQPEGPHRAPEAEPHVSAPEGRVRGRPLRIGPGVRACVRVYVRVRVRVFAYLCVCVCVCVCVVVVVECLVLGRCL